MYSRPRAIWPFPRVQRRTGWLLLVALVWLYGKWGWLWDPLRVIASRLICCQSITMEQCLEAESRIQKFCKLFEHLYGTTKCTPNMHLSCHLVECIRDYRPVYSFWCFSFERYNGILGSYHKNNHNIGKLSHCYIQSCSLLLSKVKTKGWFTL